MAGFTNGSTGDSNSDRKLSGRSSFERGSPDSNVLRENNADRNSFDQGGLAVWRFVLILDRAPRTDQVRRLGPGALLLRETGSPLVRVRFDWPAPTQGQALVAAIRSVEETGLRALRVDVDDWMTAADLAHRVGRSREAIRQWVTGQVGPGEFPPPANPRRNTTFYSWAEVLPWFRNRINLNLPEEEPLLVAANLALQLQALLPRLSAPEAVVDLLN